MFIFTDYHSCFAIMSEPFEFFVQGKDLSIFPDAGSHLAADD